MDLTENTLTSISVSAILVSTGERILILPDGPFFREGLVLMASGQTLAEGDDYNLAYQFHALSQQLARAIYAVIIISEDVSQSNFTVNYTVTGSEFTVANSDIINDISNLSTAYLGIYDFIIGENKHIPPVNHRFELDVVENIHEEAELVSSINDITNVYSSRSYTDDVYYKLLNSAVTRLSNILDIDIDTHINVTGNPHGLRAHDVGALASDGIAEDSDKAYGYTLTNLKATISSTLLESDELTNKATKSGDNAFTGAFSISSGPFFIQSETQGNYHLDMNSAKMIQRAINHISFSTDKEFILSSGTAELVLDDTNADELRFNGKRIVNESNVADHMSAGMVTTNFSFSSSDIDGFLNITGNGSTANPLEVTVNYSVIAPSIIWFEAAPGEYYMRPGYTSLSDNLSSPSDIVGATPKLADFLVNVVNTKVTITTAINGHALNGDITISKADIGLGNVQDIADVNLPVNSNHTSALANKALTTHTHGLEVYGYGPATETKDGISTVVEYDDVSNASETVQKSSFVSAKSLDNLIKVVSANKDKLDDELLPIDLMDITRYGDNSYLPIPAQGKYGAAGVNPAAYTGYAIFENDQRIVGLRNGADPVESGVYYWYCDVDAAGIMTNDVSTSTIYRPSFLPDGVDVRYVVRGNKDIFVFVGTDGIHYAVFTNGTMDATKHTGGPFDAGFGYSNWHTVPIIIGEQVYFITTNSHRTIMRTSIDRISIDDILNGTMVTPTQVLVSGNGGRGVTRTNVHDFDAFDILETTDEALSQQAAYWDAANGWFGTRNWRHATNNFSIAINPDNLSEFRIKHYMSSYFHNAFGGWWGGHWALSYTVNITDLDSGTINLDNPDQFPMSIHKTNETGAAGEVRTNGVKISSRPDDWANCRANNQTITVAHDDYILTIKHYGAETIPSIYLDKYNLPVFEGHHADVSYASNRTGRSGKQYRGALGSVLSNNMGGLFELPNDYWLANDGVGYWTIFKVDYEGSYTENNDPFGPTAERYPYTDFFDVTTRDQLRYIPRIYTNNGLQYIEGGVLTRDDNSVYAKLNNDYTLSGNYSIQSADKTVIADWMEARFLDAIPEGGTGVDHHWTLYVFPIPDGRRILFLKYRTKYNGISIPGSKSCYGTHRIEADIATDGTISNITWPANGDIQFASAGGYKPYTDYDHRYYAQAMAYVDETNPGGDNLLFILGARGKGHATMHYPHIVLNSTTLDKTSHKEDWCSYHTADGTYFQKDIGFFQINRHGSGHGINIFRHPISSMTDLNAFITSGTTWIGYFVTTRVAEGWQIYFTTEVNYFTKGTEYTLPITSIDLSAEFPTEHKNTTFYIYATADSTSAKYVLRKNKVVDTLGDIYIGEVSTNDTQIDTLEVNRALRIGKFNELSEHIDDDFAHLPDAISYTKEEVGLELVENKLPAEELTIPTWGDVFDNWLKISHNSSGAYPASTIDLSAWSYDDESDSITNTRNTDTLVGLISNTEVGDYEFETYVDSSNADDDFVGVCVAYKEEAGVQHAIVVMACGNDTRSNNSFISYNYLQSGGTTILGNSGDINDPAWNGGSRRVGWDEIKARRIYVKRTGTVYRVIIDPIVLTDGTVAETTAVDHTFDTKDYGLTMFEGLVKFGYTAQSQAMAEWANVKRPDINLTDKYASIDLERKYLDWDNTFEIEYVKVNIVGVSYTMYQTWRLYPLPISGEIGDKVLIPIDVNIRSIINPTGFFSTHMYIFDHGNGTYSLAVGPEMIKTLGQFPDIRVAMAVVKDPRLVS